MPYIEGQTWLGIGMKVGGILIIGVEDTEGMMFNIANPSTRADFRVQSGRVGLGLGGGVGLVAACVFNCGNIRQLDGMSTGWDWGVGLALGNRWSSILSGLRHRRFFATVARVGTSLRFVPGDMDNVKNAMHWLYSAYDISSMPTNQPKVVLIDTPVGEGVEASIAASIGRIEIDSVTTTQRGVQR